MSVISVSFGLPSVQRPGETVDGPAKVAPEMAKRLEHLSYKEKLGEQGLFSLEKTRFSKESYQCL